MKIGFALIRKEADACLSQGLHEEALGLYAKFIAGSAKIDPGIKSAIEKEIQRIELKMSCGDTGAIPEPSAGRIDPIKDAWGMRAIESDLPACVQDLVRPPGRSQKHASDISAADWADGMVDIYALVANDKDHPSSEDLKGRPSFDDPEDPKILLNRDSPERKRFHRDYAATSFLGIIAAFVLVGSILIYSGDWFSEIKRNKSAEVVQDAAKIVFKKTPALVGKEHMSALPDNGMEDQSAMRSGETAISGDAASLVDPDGTQAGVKTPSSPANDERTANRTPGDEVKEDGASYSEMPAVENKDIGTAPEEPDPASVIDYVLKKRRF
ncbi:MAG: hypothetical protein HY895_13970 [Deltaproteobacteria bacterium]|nr:hypothetical protein [Deltaproteobacteria bacterium]